MPIFEYRCGECRRKFEKIVLSVAAAERPACPRCGAVNAEKLVSRFATASKGGADDFGGDLGGDDGDDFGPDGGMGEDDAEEPGGFGEGEPWEPDGHEDEDDDGGPGGDDGEEDD